MEKGRLLAADNGFVSVAVKCDGKMVKATFRRKDVDFANETQGIVIKEEVEETRIRRDERGQNKVETYIAKVVPVDIVWLKEAEVQHISIPTEVMEKVLVGARASILVVRSY